MAGSTNFKVFNPNLTNMMDDNTYNTSGYRLNGAVSGLAPSNVHNKLYYQVTTMTAAFAQALANKGFTVTDDNFNNLVTVLSNIALKTDNVASATKLQTARKINSVPFDGSTDINLTPANIGALPSDTVAVTGDWNSYVNNGYYYGLNLANAPTSGSTSWYWVQTIKYADNYTYQQAHGFGGANQVSWERTQNLGVWSGWKQIPTMDLVAPSGYGLGPDSVVITNTDLNTLHNSGFYYAGSGCTNRPPGAGNGHLLTMDNTDQVSWQRYTDSTTGFGYERSWYSGVWSTWLQIATKDKTTYIVASDSGANYYWRKWSNGDIEQWFYRTDKIDIVNGNTVTSNFPVAFLNQCRFAIPTANYFSGDNVGSTEQVYILLPLTKTGATIRQYESGNTVQAITYGIYAIGN
jgi:hypothetical protein